MENKLGRCLCGNVQYEIRGSLGEARLCHCEMCRRANGTAFSANVAIPRSRYTLLRGSESIREYESSPGHFRAFCSNCGSPVYARIANQPDTIRIRLGNLPGDIDVQIVGHTWVCVNPGWYTIEDSLPQHAESAETSC